MFGFSPNKLLFTVLVIAAIWYTFKWLNRFQAGQQRRSQSPSQAQGNTSQPEPKANDVAYEELVACPKCGDYVVADKKSGCGKEACPYDK